MYLEEISKRLYRLEKDVRKKQILYGSTALTGDANCCHVFGIDNTTGNLYYKDDGGEWALASGGGGGGGSQGIQSVLNVDNGLNANSRILTGSNSFNINAGADDYTGATAELWMDSSIAYLYAQESDTSIYSEVSVKGDEGAILTTGDGTNETTLVVAADSVNITKNGGAPLEVVTSINGAFFADITGDVALTLGGNTIYTADDALAGSRIIDMDGNSLVVSYGSNHWLRLDPQLNSESMVLQAVNPQDDGNFTTILGQLNDTDVNLYLLSTFNDGVKQAQITMHANATQTDITSNSDYNFIAALNNINLGVTDASDNSYIDMTTSTITLSSNVGYIQLAALATNVYMSAIVSKNFVDDAAAAIGLVGVGGIYHNAGALRIRLV